MTTTTAPRRRWREVIDAAVLTGSGVVSKGHEFEAIADDVVDLIRAGWVVA